MLRLCEGMVIEVVYIPIHENHSRADGAVGLGEVETR